MLGINCGFGQTDLANITVHHINFKTGWVEYPRVKTGVERRCKLWPETISELEEALKERPTPKATEDNDCCFITKYGRKWVKKNDDAVAKAFSKLLQSTKLKRPGLNFYALRHTFETIAGECRDQVAVDHIMGHSRNDMASLYREEISDERLEDATNHVRKWLFPKAK